MTTSGPAPTPPGPTAGEPSTALTPTEDPLLAVAMTRSGILWIDVPDDRAWPSWFAWVEGTAYVVNGPGEQHLPWLPELVVLVLRGQDGGRLLRVRARTRLLDPAGIEWGPAVEALVGQRLNAPPDVRERWRTSCAVTALTPVGALLEGPGSYDDSSGAAPPVPSRATTVTWHPRHLGGRPKKRRGTG